MNGRLFAAAIILTLLGCISSETDKIERFHIQRVIDTGIQVTHWDLTGNTQNLGLKARVKPGLDQEIVLAGADDIWRRAIVISGGRSRDISLDVPEQGKLQFWVLATTSNEKGSDASQMVSVEVIGGKETYIHSFQVSVSCSGDNEWEKIEIPLNTAPGELVCRIKMIDNNSIFSTEDVYILLGSPIFIPDNPIVRPIVILLVIDSLRAGDTGVYGSEAADTPFLDNFSRNCVTYTQALSSSSWTMPAIKNLMSGQYSNRFAREGENLYNIRDPFPVIQEVFSQGNWYTAAVSANHLITVEKGYERGFDVFDSGPSRLWRHGSSTDAYIRVRELLEDNQDKPLFLFIHLMDPHDPYSPVDPFAQICDAPPDSAVREILHSRESGHLNFETPDEQSALTRTEKEYLHDYYRGEIRQTDTVICLLFRLLAELDLLQQSIVIITADHGEEFGEHGYYQHGKTLFEESVRVPLLIKDGAMETAGVLKDGWVSTIDIPVTMSGMAGLLFPVKSEGINIYPPDNVNLEDRMIFTLLHHRTKKQSARSLWRSAYQGSQKIMWTNQMGYRLVNLKTHPREDFGYTVPDYVSVLSNNKFTGWRGMTGLLKDFMDAEFEFQDEKEKHTDHELKQKLRQLGYIK
ncbi:sulfatase [bacterium]|nr:sulfatase [bacterium]